MVYKGFDIVESTRHGSNVKGNKKTNGIQVRQQCGIDAYLLKKTFSYPINDMVKKEEAIRKAIGFVDTLTKTK